ncbi:MAG: two-component regulator propeller domain-containing protein, partial [Bacteroidota bacterium]|nr:two-component regulator propeller domain-containing protein [Bacteroidota bacterium]
MPIFLYRTLLFILFFSLLIKAEGQVYNFSNYTVESGLSQPQILAVFQDDNGVMWFGTNGGGITKYDGKSYEYITDKDGLADNVVYCIVKDEKGKILIGTNNGLSVFDGKNFKNYSTKNGLSHDRIFNIFIDSTGRALLGTGKGISVYEDSICTILKLEEVLDNSAVFSISQDSKKNLWLCTLGSRVFKYDGNIVRNYTSKDGLKTDFVYSVLEYNDNSYWFFTDEGLFELIDNEIKRINPAGISGRVNYTSYLKDKDNNLWIASNSGIVK